MKRHLLILSTILLCLLAGSSQAHYPWMMVNKTKGKPTTATFYFEEAPRAGDGHYLDPFLKRGTVWIRTSADAEPTKFELKETKSPGKRWMEAKLPDYKALALDLNCKWGVYRYGKTDVLLHYYARSLDVKNSEEMAALAKAPHLKLNVIPKVGKDSVEIQVLWQGKPAKNAPIFVRGAQNLKANLRTDANGKASFKPKANGIVWFRAYVVEPNEKGTFEGKAYTEKRHHCSMTMSVRLGS